MKRSGLRDRMGRLFAIQLTVIGLATLVGIYLTQVIVEDLLTRQALNLEAEHFWALRADDPLQPLPNVANMRGYLRVGGTGDGIPRELADLGPGFRRVTVEGESLLTHVSDNGGSRLYLLFEGDRVSDLAFYFGILPLSFVLALMYLTLFIAHRLSQRALSPLVGLARQLEEVDFLQQGRIELNLAPLLQDADAEVAAMVQALEHFTSRLDAAIERERVFTRDAGHELRTPVAVFKGTLDLLEKDTQRPRQDLQALARMRKTVTDMEALLETLLLLARGEELVAQSDETVVNDVLSGQLDALRLLAERSNNHLALREQVELRVRAPEKVVDIVLGNLIRNALTYTNDGEVEVTVDSDGVRVADTGIGMSSEELEHAFDPFYRAESSRGATKGHGLGLSIVRRLCRQFGWTVSARSRPGKGMVFEIRFR